MTAIRLLRDKDAEELLGLKPGRLRAWRLQCRGPKWQTNPDTGRCMGYRLDDIKAWLDRGHIDPVEERRRRIGGAS